jgi:hypothetical protein
MESKESYHRTFWNLIELFPKEKSAFIHAKHNWKKLPPPQKDLLEALDTIAGHFDLSSDEIHAFPSAQSVFWAIIARDPQLKEKFEKSKFDWNKLSDDEGKICRALQILEDAVKLLTPSPPTKTLIDPTIDQVRSQTAQHQQETLPHSKTLKELVSEKVPLVDMPAVRILDNQIDRMYEDIMKKNPGISSLKASFFMAMRFRRTSLYQRITEMSFFGPQNCERIDDPDKLKPLLPNIQKGLQQVEKWAPQKKFRVNIEDAWMQLSCGRPGETEFRIYLSPRAEYLVQIFTQLADNMPPDTSFRMKTFDPHVGAIEAARADKIIVYCDRDHSEKIWQTVQRVYGMTPEAFAGRIAPGGGTFSPLPGISVTKQPPRSGKREVTGTEAIADRIGEQMYKSAKNVTQDRIRNSAPPPDFGSLYISVLEESMSQAKWYLGEEKLSDSQNGALTKIYVDIVYGMSIQSQYSGGKFSLSDMRQHFLRRLETSPVILSSAQKKYLVSLPSVDKGLMIGGQLEPLVSFCLETTGLAMILNEALKQKLPPSKGIEYLLKD